jgi:hypothetical protein
MNAPNAPITREAAQTAYSLTTAASTNANLISGSAKRFYGAFLSNPTATACYVKFFDKATTPVPASDVPFLTVALAAGAFVNLYKGELGRYMTNGLGIAVTGAAADLDVTVAVAGAKIDLDYF